MKSIEASSIRSFGVRAEDYAARLPSHIPGIVADVGDSARALQAAVAARRIGAPFFVAPLLDDNRALVAMELSGVLLHKLSGDALRNHFDALAHEQLMVNGSTAQKTISLIDQRVIDTLSDFVMAGHVLLARSRTEIGRLRSQLRESRPFSVIFPAADPKVPSVTSDRSGPIVVWAPDLPASQLGIIAFALESLHDATAVVCAQGKLPNVRARFVSRDDCVLSTASVIVDASISDPGTALALARTGVPIACASTSGAHEFLDNVTTYDPWNWRSILQAVAAARGESAPIPVLYDYTTRLQDALERSKAPLSEADVQPKVSVIVPTYNRREMLRECLQSLEFQQYDNYEVVVVNDAGEAVGDVVAEFSRARLVNHDVNGGPMRASNTGLEHAHGEYICFLSDDDLYYPDFLPRMINAMETSRVRVANCNGMIRFMRRKDGTLHDVGYRWLSYLPMDRFEVLWGGVVSLTGMVIHRSLFKQLGALDASNAAADYELLVRLAQNCDFVHVDHCLTEFASVLDSKSFSHTAGTLDRILADYQKIWDRYPGPAGSELVTRGREGAVQWLTERHGKRYWEPAIYLDGAESA